MATESPTKADKLELEPHFVTGLSQIVDAQDVSADTLESLSLAIRGFTSTTASTTYTRCWRPSWESSMSSVSMNQQRSSADSLRTQ